MQEISQPFCTLPQKKYGNGQTFIYKREIRWIEDKNGPKHKGTHT